MTVEGNMGRGGGDWMDPHIQVVGKQMIHALLSADSTTSR